MIDEKSFRKEWVELLREKYSFNKSDPAIIEKMILALALLEQLAAHQLEFIFKGGTSLVLLLENANRFSIDIDISTEHSRGDFEAVFQKITTSGPFYSFEIDAKRSFTGTFSKAHFKFFYQSNFSKNKKNIAANYVLLDIVFEKAVYPKLRQVEINSKWLATTGKNLEVVIPTVDSILGDKLTAFAPNTTGVPFNRRKETEILKQLYDVAFLIGEISDIKEVSKSFLHTAKKEIQYRSIDIEPIAILDDIFMTGVIISRRERNTGDDRYKFEEIKKGVSGLKNMVSAKNYTIEHAIEAAAKAAWFAMKLKNHNFSPLKMYQPNMDLSAYHIENPAFQFLNKLKKSIKPAFYYWYHCLDETGQLK
jgi:hypothetical protein